MHEEFRRRREALGLSLEDLSEKTLFSMRYLTAIEEGDFSVLPRAYMRMFVKSYGMHVGMDPVSVLNRFDELVAPEAEPIRRVAEEPAARSATPRKKWVVKAAIAFAVVVVVFALIIWGTREPAVQTEKTSFEALQKRDVDALSTTESAETEGEGDSDEVSPGETSLLGTGGSAEPVEGGRGKVAAPVLPEETPSATVSGSMAPENPVAADSLLVLEGEALEEIWLAVQADGGPEDDGLMRAGEQKRWEAKDRLQVTLGKPKKIVLKFQGKMVDNTAWTRAPMHLLFSRDGVASVTRMRPSAQTPVLADSASHPQ
ncbi:MAG: RodZ domain-containing protein [Candidatus Latescibacterota bacterium]